MTNQMTLWNTENSAGAVILGNYRYTIWRTWNPDRPRVLFIMLNPSTANAVDLDPTLRRCLAFAKSWGMGSLEVVNLYAYISPCPEDLKQVDAVGKENNAYIQQAITRAFFIVCAWGACKYIGQRDQEVLTLLDSHEIYCLGRTSGGYPRHPLYLAHKTPLTIYT